MLDVLTFIVILLILYTFIPFALSRWAGVGVFLGGGQTSKEKKQVALTFDDGPDPKYTNQLLDLLHDNQIKASFFVVGSKAEKHPDIILRMHREGHLIGIHNYVHQSNWLMTPGKVKWGLEKSAQAIEQITGEKPAYYRPPWGMLNVGDFFIHKNFRIILWTVMVGDWRKKGGSQKIQNRLLQRIKPGDIVVLHDSGETWGADEQAPKYMIEALERVIKELSHQGYTFATVDKII
jgi:peptidoglycan-N-acetylglucosamine deacetylase